MNPWSADMSLDKKQCRYCGSEIAASATLCPVCKRYQVAWRNTIVLLAGLAGFIALLGSAVVFMADRAAVVYRNLVWNDKVNVLYLRTALWPNFATTLSNTGDGPIFVVDITAFWREHSNQYNINKVLQPNEFSTIGDVDNAALLT